jgi:di/tricarboxylate transporter
VALLGLVAGIAFGVVETEAAFRGFGDDIVIIVASALVVSAAISRSGITELVLRPFIQRLKSTELQIISLGFIVAVLSAFMKNIGALAIFLPIAIQLSRRNKTSPARLLMPLSFCALLGGLMTLIGTSPNIVVSRMRQEILGEPFTMFDFMPVGLPLTVAGIILVAFCWRLLRQQDGEAAGTGFTVGNYHVEVLLPEGSPLVDKTVKDLEDIGGGDVTLAAIIREKNRRYTPASHWVLYAGDILVLEGDVDAIDRTVVGAELELFADKEAKAEGEAKKEERKDSKKDARKDAEDEMLEAPITEVVVTSGSRLIGQTERSLRLRDQFGINLLALSRHGEPLTTRLRGVTFRVGDLLVVRASAPGDRLSALGCIPLAERPVQLGGNRPRYRAVVILVLAMVLAATGTVSAATAFLIAAVAMVISRALPLDEAYAAIEWPILVMLAALIPISDALRTTGGSEMIAGFLSQGAQGAPAMIMLGLIMVTAMAVTPFLNNAATVLVMAPIGASFAQRLGLNPDPFLMAVAVGAACDFLTPVGHQCNTLVMGPGGYRFSDYWRLGLPLSVLVVVLAVPLIAFVWPLSQ